MITEEIRAVLSAKADALLRRSADDMAGLLHPDFVYVNAGGYKLNKAQYVENGCTSGRIVFRSQKVSELEVRQLGDVAVATMVLDDHYAQGGARSKRPSSRCACSRRWATAGYGRPARRCGLSILGPAPPSARAIRAD